MNTGPAARWLGRSGPISLRARLLLLLISVTGAFLLVLGAVTTFVLTEQINAQFNADLTAALVRPAALSGNTAGYLGAAVSWRSGRVALLTSGEQSTELEQAIYQMTAAGFWRVYNHQPFPIVLADGTRLRAAARAIRDGQVPGTPFRPGRAAVLVVAHPVATLARHVRAVIVAELITGGALLLLLALGGRWLIGRGLSPLRQMAGTAQRITRQGDLAARMPDADDRTEVGRLGAAINTMLDRIQQAFGARLRSEQKVRQFAADASHELRTPLTTIRGYAELYRQGALGSGQLPDAMRRIEQEAKRMGTLVAELLELARLDRTSSLDIAETDLAALVRDAVADARAVEPARPVRAEAPDCLVAAVDEARVRQVLANLLGNVREHTPVTTPTAVRLAQVPGGIVLEVADAGPGMAAEQAARAFDRFYRGTERPGDAGHGQPGSARGVNGGGAADGSGGSGSGLGLAIVAAIAQAHGGQATLDSMPGRGTRVRVWLPATVS